MGRKQVAKQKNKYMHTIGGCPAFWDENQICYACQGVKMSVLLIDSLRAIRNQQMLSQHYRRKNEFYERVDYGYLRVKSA